MYSVFQNYVPMYMYSRVTSVGLWSFAFGGSYKERFLAKTHILQGNCGIFSIAGMAEGLKIWVGKMIYYIDLTLKKTTRGGGGQKLTILRQHSLWTPLTLLTLLHSRVSNLSIIMYLKSLREPTLEEC